jgi:hypothetical protein
MAAYRFMINRLQSLPLSREHRNQEINNITQITKQNGYPIALIEKLDKQIKNKIKNSTNNTQTQNSNMKWITFEYHNPIIRKVTNIFRIANIKITYRVSNTIQNILKTHTQNCDKYTHSRIYSLKCNTCNKYYVGQTGRSLKVRLTEHIRYIKTNEPKSAYALHILNNQHEYATIQNSMELISTCKKGWHMNIAENLYIQLYYKQHLLIEEQIPAEETPLFRFITPTSPTPIITQASSGTLP